MKKILLLLAALACLLVSCEPFNDDDEPTAAEKKMIPSEMTWRLDSVLVIYNYNTPAETSEMLYPSDGLDVWSYTFYPCTYQFPKDLCFEGEMSGETIWMSKSYNKDFCKYICTYEGTIISAGYLRYYRDFFTFDGIKDGGWVDFMLREADTNWNVKVWTLSYNAEEELDGTVLERDIEYYSRTSSPF